jgi:hypothetical protein
VRLLRLPVPSLQGVQLELQLVDLLLLGKQRGHRRIALRRLPGEEGGTPDRTVGTIAVHVQK